MDRRGFFGIIFFLGLLASQALPQDMPDDYTKIPFQKRDLMKFSDYADILPAVYIAESKKDFAKLTALINKGSGKNYPEYKFDPIQPEEVVFVVFLGQTRYVDAYDDAKVSLWNQNPFPTPGSQKPQTYEHHCYVRVAFTESVNVKIADDGRTRPPWIMVRAKRSDFLPRPQKGVMYPPIKKSSVDFISVVERREDVKVP
jgi:hypothetical protein